MIIGARPGFALLLLSAHTHAHAQEPSPAIAGADRTYAAREFVQYAPQTALDVIRLIPGFAVQEEEVERRGLGQAGTNILINGRRVSGKMNDAVVALSRIPFGDVVRVEISDGASVNVPGISGQAANVIVDVGGVNGQFSWRPEFRSRQTDPVLLDGSASLSGEAGRFDYTVGIQNLSRREGAEGPARVLSGGGPLLDLRDEIFFESSDRPRISGSLRYDGPDGSVGNLNLAYQRFLYRFRELSERNGPSQVDRSRTLRQTERDYSFEAGADYEFGFGGGALKLIGLHRLENSPVDTRVITAFADESPATGNRFFRRGKEHQSIARAEQRWDSGSARWQVSAEGAFSGLDNVGRFFILGPAGDFEEVPFPGGSGSVRESRAEVNVSHGRRLSPTLAVQASAGAEYSELRQRGAGRFSRSFFRPKGFVSAAWQAAKNLDVSAKVERRVGQIRFIDFLASVDLSDEQENVRNPLLEPPESWDGEIEVSRGLGDFGRATVRVYGRLISNIVDTIPIGDSGQAIGNIDSATLYGVEWNSTTNFDPLGWRGARLDARLQFQDSDVEDPTTGERRRISNNLVRLIELNLRHDVPRTSWAWGAGLADIQRAPDFRIGETSRFFTGAVGSLFVENKDVFGLTVRATVRQALGADQERDRIVFLERRGGPIEFIEFRRRTKGTALAFSVSGKF